jgi:hypothetical protein
MQQPAGKFREPTGRDKGPFGKRFPHEFPINQTRSDSPMPVKQIRLTEINPKSINVGTAVSNTLRDELSSPNIYTRELAVAALEKKIITMQGHCPDDTVDTLRVKTFQLNPETMDQYLDGPGIFDHNYQDSMGCLIDAMLSKESAIPDARLRRWITDIKRIGEPSSEGMAFKLQSGAYSLYVDKIANDPDEDGLPHEAVVGMGAINNLRDRIPTFVHTYGAFMCSPPVLDEQGNVLSWCPAKTNTTTYLVLEDIDNSVTLTSLAWDLTESEFLEIYLQIINAINLAHKEFDFTHFDLHANNVLIQTFNYDVSVPLYKPDGTTVYINTRRLARIIDFGMSHIYLQGQHFGNYGLEPYGVDPEGSFPIHDAYKILLSTYYHSLTRSEKGHILSEMDQSGISSIVDMIYSFFGEGITTSTRIKMKRENQNDFFQPSELHKPLTLDSLISFILTNYNPGFISSDLPDNSVLTVCNDKCVNWNKFIQQTFDQTALPATLEDYCEAHVAIDKLSREPNKGDLIKWIDQFNIRNAYDSERIKKTYVINQCIDELNGIKLSNIADPTFDHGIYENELKKLIVVKSKIRDLLMWISAVTCAFSRNHDLSYVSRDLSSFMRGLTDIKTRINDYREIIKRNRGIWNYEINILQDLILQN